MTLAHLNDEVLDQKLLQLVRTEREVLTDILHHLREVERRRLFSKFKFPSLFDYAIKHLGYSEDQAARRINAMRLMKELPSIETKIESGALTLSQLTKAQSMFRRERKANCARSSEAKLELLTMIENTSIRATEKTLENETYAPQPIEKSAPLSIDQFTEGLQAKLKQLLDVRAHTLDGNDLVSLIDQLADLGLERWDPVMKAERAKSRAAKAAIAKTPAGNDAVVPATFRVTSEQSRPAPSAIRHALFLRDQGKCDVCRFTKHIQVDHIVPFAKGGTNELENLRLLCRSCNQRHAIESYGTTKMAKYLKSPRLLYITTHRRTPRRVKTERRRVSSL